MLEKYRYKETERIKKLLIEIEALKIVFGQLSPLPHIEESLRRESLLKSALFSARVEGNLLTLEKARLLNEKKKEKELAKLELFNLLRAYRFINMGKVPSKLTLPFIFKMHKLIMKGISSNAGRFRREPWAIFNQAGVAIYIAASHFNLHNLMEDFVNEINKFGDHCVVIAAIAQFVFEKIHPFADGNGRVGRLISSYILRRGNFNFRGLLSFEEYMDDNREVYYGVLEPNVGMTGFVEFFLESIISQAKKVLEKLKIKDSEKPEDALLPRRREIFEIIKEHPHCSFDFISRRFLGVNIKTLHYDLKKLREQGFIIRVGVTRGSLYKSKV